MADWHTTETARNEWVDAPLDDGQLVQLLEVAKQAVLAYAPALPTATMGWVDGYYQPTDTISIPDNYRYAQLQQARNIWNSAAATPAGDFDSGSYGLTTHPLDWQIKQILRPRTIFGGPVG
jgi:hypothetical protein